ncbi:hypothetical protein L3Q82_022784, partial [Scortum barcoo]
GSFGGVPVDVLQRDIAVAIKQRLLAETDVHITVCHAGTFHFVKRLSREHFGAFELKTSDVREVALLEHGELLDDYPLAA